MKHTGTYRGQTISELVIVLRLVDELLTRIGNHRSMRAWQVVQAALSGDLDLVQAATELEQMTSRDYLEVELDEEPVIELCGRAYENKYEVPRRTRTCALPVGHPGAHDDEIEDPRPSDIRPALRALVKMWERGELHDWPKDWLRYLEWWMQHGDDS